MGRAKAGHLGGPLSAVDILTVLYGGVLRVRPDEPDWPDRDRFVLSKGHASIGLYAVLALAGYFPVDELDTFDSLGTRLQGHPDMTRLPGLDMSTGSLGVGISAAAGMALGAKRQGRDVRVFTMLGDGECQEGQVWEAAIFAAREGLDGLFAIVDVNGLQQYGWPDADDGIAAPALADRAAGGHLGGLRLADAHRRRSRPGGHRRRPADRGRRGRTRPADGRAGRDDEGPGRLVHGEPLRVARPRPDRGRGGPGPRGARRMSAATSQRSAAPAVTRPEVPEARSQRVVFGETLAAMALERDDILVLDGDLANSTRADIVAELAPHAFIEAGIAEQNLFGVAAGLATMGFTPYISTFACFAVARALDQIRVTIAQPHLGVKIVGGYSGILTGSTGKTHQMVDDLAIMRAMPGMTVLAPGDDVEAEAMLRAAADLPGPVYLRLARDAVRRVFDRPVWPGPGPRTLRTGDGRGPPGQHRHPDAPRTLEAAELLAADGLSVDRDPRAASSSPSTAERSLAALAGAALVVTVEEHTVIGGLGGAVAELLAEQGGGPPLRRIGLPDVFGESGPNDALLEHYGLSASRVAERVRAWADELTP